MNDEVWRSHYDLKAQTKTLAYYPTLALIYRWIKKHGLKYRKHCYFNERYHRFTVENVIIDFEYLSK